MIGKATASDWLIRTDEDHACALIRIDELLGCPPDSPESDELQLLTILVEDWEIRQMPIGKDEEDRAVEKREADVLRARMADLLTRTANALKGPPAPLTQHSWHDLPEAAAMITWPIYNRGSSAVCQRCSGSGLEPDHS